PSRPIAQNLRTVSPDADGPQPAASATATTIEKSRTDALLTGLAEPAPGEAGALQAAPKICVLAHHAPDERAAMVFDHRQDRALVDPDVVVGDPAEVADDAAVPERDVERERPVEGVEEAVL